MKNSFLTAFLACAFVFLLNIVASGQSSDRAEAGDTSKGASVAAVPGKVGVFVVRSVAKGAWATTKFVAKDVAKPVAKTIFLKAAPKLAIYTLKRTPAVAKKALPVAVKLALL